MESIENKIVEINTILDEIEKILEKITGIIDYADFTNKLSVLVMLCRSRINNQCAILTDGARIKNIINGLSNIYNQLKQYNDNKANNPEPSSIMIANINSWIQNVSTYIISVPYVENNDNIEIINSLFKKLKIDSKQIISKLNQDQKNFTQIQTAGIKALNLTHENFNSTIKKHEQEYEKLLEDNKNNYIQLTNNSKEKIKKIEEEINKLYGIVADKSLVGSQAKYANQSKNFANRLFVIAFGLMLIGAAITIVPILIALWCNPLAIDWKLILYKIPISFSILIPAFYAANESKKQRDRENLYRELEIKMCAIKPYFNDIGDGVCEQNSILEKDRIKLKLAEKLLSPKELKNDDNIVIPKEVVDIIKEVLKVCPTSKK